MHEYICAGVVLALICLVVLRDQHTKHPKPAKKRNVKAKPAAKREEMVYVMANPSYRAGVFKIGLTTRTIEARMGELFSTGVPTPFVKCVAIVTGDCKSIEKALHKKFNSSRINPRREFFSLTEDNLKELMDYATSNNCEVKFHDKDLCAKALKGAWEAF